MKIGIIGAGHIGSTLARDFGKLHHTVILANSRGPASLAQIAREVGARPGTIEEAVAGVDLLVVTVPIQAVLALPEDLLADLPPQVPVLDTTNYYPPVSGHIPELDKGMVEAEWVAQVLRRPVIKVFNSIYAHSLRFGGRPKGTQNRIALPIAGDSSEQKRTVMALVDAIGFDAYDAGPLSESWRYQPGNPAYCSDPNLEQLPALLAKGDREKAPRSRDAAGRMFGNVLLEYPQDKMVRVLRLSTGLDLWKPGSWAATAGLIFTFLRSKLARTS